MLTGRCECGTVRFRSEGPIADLSHCHCSMCRRLHGAAFVTWAGVPKSGFSYQTGEDAVSLYASSDAIDRLFCSRCGSSFMCDFKAEPDRLYLAMGNLDGNPESPPAYHFFVGSKAPWITIGDELVQWEEWPH